MLNHYFYKILFFCLLLLYPFLAKSQLNHGNHNFFEFQDKAYYFGLTFGYNHSNFQLLRSQSFILNDSFDIVQGLGGSGLNISVVTNIKLGQYFDFRLLPGFSFVGRKIYFLNVDNKLEQTKSIESVLVQVPFQLRYKSEPFHDMRMFLLAGAKYTFDVASNVHVLPDQADRIVRISPHDFSV